MILATRHIGIVVADMDRSVRFWRDVMGLEVAIDFRQTGAYIERVQALKGVDLRMVKLTAPDGSMIELLADDAHPSASHGSDRLCDHGIRHIAFNVTDIAVAWRTLSDHGCRPLSEPTDSPDGNVKLFFTRDPEGNLLEIVQELKPSVHSSGGGTRARDEATTAGRPR